MENKRAWQNSRDTLKDKLAAGRFVVTAEITPPVSFDAAELLAKAMPLKGLADAVNVTDGAGARAHLGAVTAAGLLLQNGIEPILQFTCRDRNRIALQGDLMAAAALGIRNMLMLQGDDPKQGDQPDAKPVFDLDTVGLTQLAHSHARQGRAAARPQATGKARLLHRCGRHADRSAGRMGAEEPESKIAAGCEFAQTQFCMDVAVLRRYMARLAEHGIKLPMLIGISPLRSAKSARWMREKLFGTIIPDAIVERMETAADPAAEGRRICVDLMREIAEIPGVAGVHIMAPGNEAGIADVIREPPACCADSLRQRALYPIRREQHPTHAHAGGIEHRVGDRRRNRADRRLAGAGWRPVRPVDVNAMDGLRRLGMSRIG